MIPMDDAERAELRHLLHHGGVVLRDSTDALLRLSMRGCVVRRSLPDKPGLLHELTPKGRALAAARPAADGARSRREGW